MSTSHGNRLDHHDPGIPAGSRSLWSVQRLEVKQLETPADTSRTNDEDCVDSCHQLLRTSHGIHPAAINVHIEAAHFHKLATAPLSAGCDVSVSTSQNHLFTEINCVNNCQQNVITTTDHYPVTSASRNYVTSVTIITMSDNRIVQKGRKTWTSRARSYVTQRVDVLLRHLCFVYITADVIKAVTCLSALRPLFVYLCLYYWRLSAVNIVSMMGEWVSEWVSESVISLLTIWFHMARVLAPHVTFYY